MLTERPLLSKQEVLRALDPTGRAGDSAFRRLKRDGYLTGGLEIRPRRAGRINGSVVAFCSLNRDAATAYRKGALDLSRRLARRAAKVEGGGAARRLAEVVSRDVAAGSDEVGLDGIYARALVADREPADLLARSVSDARRDLASQLDRLGVRFVFGTISRLHEDTAEIATANLDRFTLLASAFPARLRHVGGRVSVRTETLGEGVLWTVVEPAWSDEDEEIRAEDPFGDLRPSLPVNLEELLQVSRPAKPLTLVGPGLAWR
jgi:hypothetical protein